MALLVPKRVILSRDSSVESDSHYLSKAEVMESTNVHRKRKRLTHLSPEERLMRRKLKNRVAAQTARDRKKQKMEYLEQALAELEAENRLLQSENDKLRLTTDSLLEENQSLKSRVGGECGVVGPVDDRCELSESAAGASSHLPQLDNPLHGPSDDSQSDSLLGLLEQISELTSPSTPEQDQTTGALSTQTESLPKTTQTLAGEMVGPTTAELESLKELIHFDHVYVKPDIHDQDNDKIQQQALIERLDNPKPKKTVVIVPHNTSLSSKVTIVGPNGEKKVIRKVKAPNGISTCVNSTSSGTRPVKMVKILPKGGEIKPLPKIEEVLNNNSNISSVPKVTEVIDLCDTSKSSASSTTKSHNLSSTNNSSPVLSSKSESGEDGLEFTEADLDWLTEQLEKELENSSTSNDFDSCDGLSPTNLTSVMSGNTQSPIVIAEDAISSKDNEIITTISSGKNKRKLSSTDIFNDGCSLKQPKLEIPTLEQQLSTGTYTEMDPFDFLNVSHEINSTSSGYGSDGSDIGSPKSDRPSELNDLESSWEESFTELFPGLI